MVLMDNSSSLTCLPSADSAFGPIVSGCRDNFDFTFAFEQYFFSIAPSVTLLLLAPFRLRVLSKRKTCVGGAPFRFIKLCSFALFAILQLTLVILWATQPQIGIQRASLAATTLSFVVSLALGVLSFTEHSKSLRPSILLNAYLLITLVFDVALLRTLWLSTFDSLIRDLFTTSFALKTVTLFLEAKEKQEWFGVEDMLRGPEESSGVYSQSFFWWLNSMIMRGFRQVLKPDDLYSLDKRMSSELLNARFWKAWNTSSVQGKYKLIFVMLRVLWWPFLLPVLPRLFLIAFTFCQPLLVNRFLDYLQSPVEIMDANIGYGMVGAYGLVYIGMAISSGFYWHRSYRCITMLRGTLVAAIYSQTTEIGINSLDNSAAVTLMSTDVERLVKGLREVHELWANVIQIALATWLLERELGIACIAPVLVAGASVVGTVRLSSTSRAKQKIWVKQIQKRVGITTNILGSMKSVKILGLSGTVSDIIANLRLAEMRSASAFRQLGVYTSTLAQVPLMISPAVTLSAFTIIALRSNTTLDPTRLFTSLSLLIILSQPLFYVFSGIMELMSAIGCFERIQKYLTNESRSDHRLLMANSAGLIKQRSAIPAQESTKLRGGALEGIEMVNLGPKELTQGHLRFNDSEVISVRNGSFGWAKDGAHILHDINLSIKRSQLTFLIGPVASGKTTLLKALLGETLNSKGFVYISDFEVAWCEQTPWLVNASVQRNIIGFSDFDITLYRSVIHACDLEADLATFPNGDQTNVGSKGAKLSGGQKQRIAVARAVYARKTIAIFDDIFSGLDRSTERKVFDRLLGPQGLLRKWGTTVVVATHAVNLLPSADHIIALGSDGTIVEQGTLEELNTTKGYTHHFCLEHASDSASDMDSVHLESEARDPSTLQNKQDVDKTGPSVESTRQLGDYSVYRYYFLAVGWRWTFVFILFQVLWAFFGAFPTVWLEYWSEANATHPNQRIGYYIGVYTALQVTGLLSAAVTCWVTFNFMAKASGIWLHGTLLRTVMSAPMQFYSKTDTGSIATRFSQDIQLIDGQLPLALMCVVSNLLISIAQSLLIASATFYIALCFPALIAVFYFVQKYYLRTSRQLRLLDLEEKAPVYTHYIESLSGLTTIRAFAWQTPSIDYNNQLVDRSQKPFYLLFMIQRWLTLVLDVITTVLAVIVVAVAVKLRGGISIGFTGVSLTQLISITGYMKLTILFWTQLETSIGAVSRIKQFSASTEDENSSTRNCEEPPSSWPDHGEIKITNISAAYNSRPVLSCLTLAISPGEHIGICGRTGSGKSSLLHTLTGLLPLTSGAIAIDGIPLCHIPLSTLRARLNSVPQDSLLIPYSTVRQNLDPYSNSSTSALEEVLEKVGLSATITRFGGLDGILLEDALSHGQKQLLSVARALLRPSNIVLLDEVAGGVDRDTEAKVRNIIKEDFKGKTVVSVAHRLETIRDSDRVIVMDEGRFVEVGEPGELLGREGSAFRRLWEGGRKVGRS